MNIIKEAFKNYRKYLGEKLALSLSFTMFVLAALAIGMLGSYLFVITIPLIVLPIFICLQVANNSIKDGMILRQRNFFAIYPLAFTPPLFGTYKVLSIAVKSILIYLGLSLLTSFIFLEIYAANDPVFAQQISDIVLLQANGNMDELIKAYENNVTIAFISSLSMLISGGVTVLLALHFFGVNTIALHLAFSMPSMTGRMAGTMHRQSLKIFRKDFLSDYFQATWFVAPPLLIGLAGGILATYFVTNNKYLVL
ncbi:MAG: hypothetical protein WC282_04420, partial [Bacilli bacterium]